MPELPEVETMVRGIRPVLAGRRIRAVARCRCACKPIETSPAWRTLSGRLKGRLVTGVRRLAKRVLMELDVGDVLAVEPRMTGLMLLADPPDRGHLRIRWDVVGDDARVRSVWFWDRRGLGTVRLYTAEQFAEQLGPHRIGPDALAITAAEWAERLGRTKRAVKVALLDQKLVAGIGNLYASEILYRAGVHPELPADRLNDTHIARLHAATQTVLSEAIRSEGSTLGDGTYRNALNRAGGYQNQHRVYGRAAEPCPGCRKPIVRIVQAQRSTFYCGRCQK